ncbi:MAG: adenylate/guanylate cyclase domain-containing protein, partial [Spirochaetales bacterium]|nr:adenylate/guanylate cyclase domain-containing protein [Spirochaetales bacterium]
GDMVNLASRIEGLTKVYKEPLIVSESVQKKIAAELPSRLLDKVVVKGRLAGVGIYSVKRKLSTAEENAWNTHQEGMDLFYSREFPRAAECFRRVLDDIPDDVCARMHLSRCEEYAESPPARSWTGVVEMEEK